MDENEGIKTVIDFLKTGGCKGTRIIHNHLKDEGIKMSRKRLLAILHTYAKPSGYVSIGGIRQKSWIV